MTLDYQALPMPVRKPKSIELGGADDVGLRFIIWSVNENRARRLDDALTSLLVEYDYDVLSGRSEFRGTFFIKYKSSKKTPELERDFEIFLGRDPNAQPGARLPAEHQEKWGKLKDALETVKAFIVVGTILVGSIAAVHELHEEVNKAFGHTAAESALVTQQDRRLVRIPLKAELIRIDMQKNPRLFERMLNTQVERNLTARAIIKRKQSKPNTRTQQR